MSGTKVRSNSFPCLSCPDGQVKKKKKRGMNVSGLHLHTILNANYFQSLHSPVDFTVWSCLQTPRPACFHSQNRRPLVSFPFGPTQGVRPRGCCQPCLCDSGQHRDTFLLTASCELPLFLQPVSLRIIHVTCVFGLGQQGR